MNKKTKKPMTLAQKLAFYAPFGKAHESKRLDRIPHNARMGIKANAH